VGEVYDADVFQSDCNVSDIVNFLRGPGGRELELRWSVCGEWMKSVKRARGCVNFMVSATPALRLAATWLTCPKEKLPFGSELGPG
jgi:hypothetical protein